MADDPKPDGEDDDTLLSEIEARYEAARDHASQWREGGRECFRFYADDQWDEADIAKMKEQQRPLVTFNRIKRLVNAVIGHEANNRAEVRYIPRTPGDSKVNELLTNAGAYFRDQCDAEFEESDAFRDMIICGMGWTNDRLSDAQNPEYDLIEERVDPMEMLWDSSSKKPNLADGRYLFRRKRYTEKEVKTIWPDFKGPFKDAFDDAADDFDGMPHESNRRTSYQKDDGVGTNDVKPDILVLEYQYKEREAFYTVSLPSVEGSPDSAPLEIRADKMDDALKEKLRTKGIPLVMKRKTVARRCFVIGRTIVQGPDTVYPHDFTYHCITGFRDRERNYWQGIVKSLLDPQRWSNKWLAQIMFILNSNAKGGVLMEVSAVDDMNEFKRTWADPGEPTVFADGALEKQKVIPKPPPLYPQGVDKLLEYANASFTDVSGVNQELLGLADREQAGVLEYQRKQSAVTLLAPLFDSLRRFRYMQGRCWLYMMQTYISDGRIIRITQDDGQKIGIPFGGPPEQQAMLPPQWKMPETAEFDVIVDQAASAPNQKEQTWGVLSQLFPVLKDTLAQAPEALMLALEYSPLPDSFVQKLRELQQKMAQQPPKPDPETMKAEAQIKAKEAELQLKQQEHQLSLAVEQQKAQMQLQIEQQKMQLEIEKAQMQMGIEREKAGQAMQLQQQQAQFDTGLQTQKAEQEAASLQQKQALEADFAQQQSSRDDQAAQAKIAREDKIARAKAKRQPKQPEAGAD